MRRWDTALVIIWTYSIMKILDFVQRLSIGIINQIVIIVGNDIGGKFLPQFEDILWLLSSFPPFYLNYCIPWARDKKKRRNKFKVMNSRNRLCFQQVAQCILCWIGWRWQPKKMRKMKERSQPKPSRVEK